MLWDYIVVGGGLAGSVVSNRLLHQQPEAKILVVEAGQNANDNHDILYPNGTGTAQYTWNVPTAPQEYFGGRSVNMALGTALGGGSVVNGANWVRGDQEDYDVWGEDVGDDRWSYGGLLPYMKSSEAFQHKDRNPEQHGFEGPSVAQTVSSTGRGFPLRDQVLQSWNDIGFNTLPGLDGNAGSPVGVGDLCENRNNGKRQIASVTYPLDGVTVLTDTLVQRVLVDKNMFTTKATGVVLANGTEIQSRNTILSAGAIRTPQLLMLSGIGPAEELEKHQIKVNVESSGVGKNLIDHSMIDTQWKIKNPGEGWIPGSGNPIFEQEKYGWGFPQDFMVGGTVNREGLIENIAIDEGAQPDPDTHPLLKKKDRNFLEYVLMYSGGANDGSVVTLQSFLFLNSARGSVTLPSTNATDFPIVDPKYLSTATDRYALRKGLRNIFSFAGSKNTPMSRDILDGEIVPEGQQPLREDMTDEELDAKLAAGARSAWHPHGTAAMGDVVDSSLKVNGVDGLYVVDASVIPVPITAHIQLAIYALAEQAADIISQKGFWNSIF